MTAPGPGEIQVEVQASSLNFHDYVVVAGLLPVDDQRIPLSDGAGVVTAAVVGTRRRPYRVEIALPAFDPEGWRRGLERLAGDTLLMIRLLDRELPDEVVLFRDDPPPGFALPDAFGPVDDATGGGRHLEFRPSDDPECVGSGLTTCGQPLRYQDMDLDLGRISAGQFETAFLEFLIASDASIPSYYSLAWLWFVNLYNFMDGMDGLAGLVERRLSQDGELLLELLYQEPGRVYSRDAVVEAVWPEDDRDGISEQAIDALARRLRERLAEVDPSTRYVVTVRGHGLRLDNPSA